MDYPLLDAGQLARYFARIGYDGSPAADLATLRDLHRLHPQAIAFESLDSLCGRTPSLQPDDVFDKLVTSQRGGYCFEQNQLLLRVLLTLGFRPRTLAARVLLPDRAMPRTHKVLLVTADDQDWLVDVGFGGMTMTAPLQLAHDTPQQSPHEPWRVESHDGEWRVSALVDGEWSPKFSVGPALQTPADYDMANWVVANFPDSRFRNDLIAARPDARGRHALLNDRLSYHRHGHASQHIELADAAEALAALRDLFLIDIDAVPGLPLRLEGLFARR